MSEQTFHAAEAATTAGGLLRQARQAQGLHIAALAAAIKVVPRKLELLESDQFDQLPDATFTRALAQTVCRALKIDAAPILALLPPLPGNRLGQVANGMNTPFHERPGRLERREWASVASPALWIAGVLLIAAIVIYAMPSSWLQFAQSAASRAPADASPATLPTPATVVPPVAAPPAASQPAPAAAALPAPAVIDTPAAAAPAATASATPVAGVLQLRPIAPSWVQAIDGRGQTLLSRVVQPGEDLDLDGELPLRLRIGNANVMRLQFRGQPVDLRAYTRDNIAKLELK